jgi:hypothetical protein
MDSIGLRPAKFRHSTTGIIWALSPRLRSNLQEIGTYTLVGDGHFGSKMWKSGWGSTIIIPGHPVREHTK